MSRGRDIARASVRVVEMYLYTLYSVLVLTCSWFGHRWTRNPDGRRCGRCGER